MQPSWINTYWVILRFQWMWGGSVWQTQEEKTQRIARDEMRGENRENEKCNGEKKSGGKQ